jgi:hypothetical protein
MLSNRCAILSMTVGGPHRRFHTSTGQAKHPILRSRLYGAVCFSRGRPMMHEILMHGFAMYSDEDDAVDSVSLSLPMNSLKND